MKHFAVTLRGGAIALAALFSMIFCPSPAAPPAAPPATAPAALSAGYTAPPLPVCDPMEWHEPTELPTIDDPLTEEEYQKRAAALHLPDQFDVQEAKSLRTQIVVVKLVQPKSSALAAGIKPGDIIAAMNGQLVKDSWDFAIDKSLPDQTTFAVVTPGTHGPRQVKVPEGPLGADFTMQWNVAASWAQDPQRDAKFDPFMQVVAAAFNSDRPLSQAALARAQRGAGCHSRAVACAACLLAYEQWEFDKMLPFGAIALKTVQYDEKSLFVNRLMLGGIASFKLPYILSLTEAIPGREKHPEVGNYIQQAVDAWQKLPNRVHPNPLAELDAFKFRDVSAQLVSLLNNNNDLWDTPNAARQLRDNGKFTMKPGGGEYMLHVLGPSGANADLCVECTVEDSDKRETRFGRSFSIGMADSRDLRVPVLKVTLFANGKLQISRYTAPDFTVLAPPTPDGHHRVRIIVLEQRCEVICDGKRIFYGTAGPPEEGRKLGIMLHPVGVKAVIHDFTWRTAGPRKKA